MPNIDEATFRSFLLAAIKAADPEMGCQTEWNHFDLLLQQRQPDCNAVVELKFYVYRRTRELDGSWGNWKGGAGPKNEGEMKECIRKVHNLQMPGIHSKFLVLVYEMVCERKSTYSFRASYSDLVPDGVIRVVKPVVHGCDGLSCTLLEIA